MSIYNKLTRKNNWVHYILYSAYIYSDFPNPKDNIYTINFIYLCICTYMCVYIYIHMHTYIMILVKEFSLAEYRLERWARCFRLNVKSLKSYKAMAWIQGELKNWEYFFVIHLSFILFYLPSSDSIKVWDTFILFYYHGFISCFTDFLKNSFIVV